MAAMMIRRLAAAVACLFLAGCAADDPVGTFAGQRAADRDTVVVETDTLDVDLEALADDDPSAAVEIPDDALDLTGWETVDIDIQDNAFTQRVVVISEGTTVTWTNQGRNEHNVRPAVDGAFEPIATALLATKGTQASLSFPAAGDFPYFCSVHGTASRGQTGRIIVVP